MLQDVRVTVSELLMENQQGERGGGENHHPTTNTQIRVTTTVVNSGAPGEISTPKFKNPHLLFYFGMNTD